MVANTCREGQLMHLRPPRKPRLTAGRCPVPTLQPAGDIEVEDGLCRALSALPWLRLDFCRSASRRPLDQIDLCCKPVRSPGAARHSMFYRIIFSRPDSPGCIFGPCRLVWPDTRWHRRNMDLADQSAGAFRFFNRKSGRAVVCRVGMGAACAENPRRCLTGIAAHLVGLHYAGHTEFRRVLAGNAGAGLCGMAQIARSRPGFVRPRPAAIGLDKRPAYQICAVGIGGRFAGAALSGFATCGPTLPPLHACRHFIGRDRRYARAARR